MTAIVVALASCGIESSAPQEATVAQVAARPAAPAGPTADVVARRVRVWKLAKTPGPSARPALLAALHDDDPEVRRGAASGLRRVAAAGGGDAIDLRIAVSRILSQGSVGPGLAALSVLEAYPIEAVRDDYERAMVEGPDAVAEAAAGLLVNAGGLVDPAEWMARAGPARARVARVLASTGASVHLAPLVDDPDPAVRLAANYGHDGRGDPAPLVLLVSIDTLRADRLSAYGNPAPTTSHLDRLARHGVLFEVARSQAPWTLASHASLFTGCYPSDVGVRDVTDALPAGRLTLAEVLSQRGFVTAAVTSNPYLTTAYGLDQGFQWLESEHDQSATRVTDRAIPLLQGFRAMSQHGPGLRGLFLFVHYFDPHEPYTPPAPWSSLFDRDPTGGRPVTDLRDPTPSELDSIRSAYDGEIAFADQEIGRLLAWTDRLAYRARDVYVVSDHGEELHDHGHFGHASSLYEEQVRIPFIVGRRETEGRLRGAARLVDLMPTVLARLGIAAPPGTRGRDLEQDGDRASFAECHFKGMDLTALADVTKVLDLGDRRELYDLESDPGERHDLGQSEPQAIAAARARLTAVTPRRAPDSRAAAPSSGQLDHLRSLGYVD